MLCFDQGGSKKPHPLRYRRFSFVTLLFINRSISILFIDPHPLRYRHSSSSSFVTLLFIARMGKRKRKVGDSDGDDTDEDDSDDDEEEENEKSIVLDNGNCTDSNKETEGSSDSVTGGKLDGDSSGGGSSESGFEKEKEIAVRSGESSDGGLVGCENNDVGEPAMEILEERIVQNGAISLSKEAEAFENEKQKSQEIEPGNLEGTEGQHPSVSSSRKGEDFECGTNDAEVNVDSESKPVVHEDTVVMSTDVSDTVKPLNFDEFNSAAELEEEFKDEEMVDAKSLHIRNFL